MFQSNKLNDIEAQNIVDRYLNGERGDVLAKEYSVSKQTVSNILHGRTKYKVNLPTNIKNILKDIKGGKNRNNVNLPTLDNHQNNLIIGSLLGDGWLSKGSKYGDSRFCKQQKNSEHIEWLYQHLHPYSKKVIAKKSDNVLVKCNGELSIKKVSRRVVGYQLYTVNNYIFSSLRSIWYSGSKKIVPPELVLNNEILAIWYVDDGSNDFQRRVGSIATHGFSFAEVEFLKKRLKIDVGIRADVKDHHGMPYLLFFGEDYDLLINTVAPYVCWDCFQYKINKRLPLKHKKRKSVKINSVINELF